MPNRWQICQGLGAINSRNPLTSQGLCMSCSANPDMPRSGLAERPVTEEATELRGRSHGPGRAHVEVTASGDEAALG